MQQIKSDGESLTIDQREREARRHIAHKLARIEQECWTLNEREAAGHCQAAIFLLNFRTRKTRKERTDEPRT